MAEKKKQSFEDSLSRLEEIVAALEDEKLPLDKSVKLYEEGVKLVGACSKELESAERKIKMLQRRPDGEIAEVDVNEESFG